MEAWEGGDLGTDRRYYILFVLLAVGLFMIRDDYGHTACVNSVSS